MRSGYQQMTFVQIAFDGFAEADFVGEDDAFGDGGADGEEGGVDLVGVEVDAGGGEGLGEAVDGAGGCSEGEEGGPVEAVVGGGHGRCGAGGEVKAPRLGMAPNLDLV